MQADESSVVVDFVSSAGGSSFSCSYGLTQDSLNLRATASSFGFPTIGELAQARLSGLAPATRYYYACTDGVATSDTYSFVNQQVGSYRVHQQVGSYRVNQQVWVHTVCFFACK